VSDELGAVWREEKVVEVMEWFSRYIKKGCSGVLLVMGCA
jgi:hypothetical protein